MKRLFTIIFLCGMVFPGHAFAISDSNKESYLKWIKKHGAAWSYALAVAPNGCGWYDSGSSIYEAKRKALRGCKKSCKTTCEIKDVDGKSAFIKQRGSSGSSSTASTLSSGKVWCAHSGGVTATFPVTCRAWDGKAYNQKYLAEAEHKRLKGSSSSYSTASSSSKIWCATKYSVSKTSRYSCTQNKGKAFHSYSSALAEKNRLNKSSSGSGTLVWCGKSFKLSCSSSSSSSTASSSGSEFVWCATKYSVSKTSRYSCTQNKGKAFWTYSSALAEKNRLNKSSSSYSTTASSSGKVWCGTKKEVTRVSRYSCEFYKGGKAFDTQSEATVFHKRLKGSSSSSSSTASSSPSRKKIFYCVRKIGTSVYVVGNSKKSYRGKNYCGAGNRVFWDEGLADVEKERLERNLKSDSGSSTASSSSGYGSLVWCGKSFKMSCSDTDDSNSVGVAYCYDSSLSRFYKPFDGTCFSSDKQITKQEYTSKRLNSSSSSTASSSNSNLVWCATNKWWRYTLETSCRSAGGKIYPSKYQAVAANKRLKAASTPLVKTASLTIRSNVNGDRVYIDGNFKGTTRLDLKLSKGRHTIRIEKNGYEPYEETIYLTDNLIIRGHLEKVVKQQVQTAAVDSSLELEFWKSVKDSDDPDMFREYLRQFPQGVYAGLAKLKVKKLGGDTTEVAKSSIPDLDYGRYHALVIGNNDYDHLPNLKTAVNDATKVASVLENRYGFSVKLLKNASRSNIVSALSAFRKTISRDNNFLLYYAGHGHLDEAANEGYWLPVDAELDDPSNWLQNDTIVAQLRAMEAKHVMVVADSCFSGTITRGINIEQRTPEWLRKIVKKKARIALTSGGLEPVSDFGGGSHSSFAKVFISLLEENTDVLDASQLFSQLRPKVMVNSTQTPEFGKIHLAGDDGGDFLFVRQK